MKDHLDKTAVLLNLLNERYNASHKIRERSFSLMIWVLGSALALIWILVDRSNLTLSQKGLLTAFVIMFGAINFLFLQSLKRGFDSNRKVMIKIEQAIGCYDCGNYIESEPIYPKEYKLIHKRSLFSHFGTTYLLIFLTALILVVIIWVSPISKEKSKDDSSENKTTSLTTEIDGGCHGKLSRYISDIL